MNAAPTNILVVLDDNPRILAEAVRIARQEQARVTGLFVMDATWNGYVGHDWLSGSGSRADFLDYVKEEEMKMAQEVVTHFKSIVADLRETHCIVAAGDVVQQIREEMVKGYDLVIMGFPLRRGLEIMRSNLEKICEDTTIRVLLVP